MSIVEPSPDSHVDDAPALFDVAENFVGGYGQRVTRFVDRAGDGDVHREEDLLRRGAGLRRTTGPGDAKAPAWWVAEAEGIVLALAAAGHTVTSDDLHARYPHEPSATGSAFGALFKRLAREGRLVLVGYRPSTRPEARARVVGEWRAP